MSLVCRKGQSYRYNMTTTSYLITDGAGNILRDGMLTLRLARAWAKREAAKRGEGIDVMSDDDGRLMPVEVVEA